MEQSKTDRGAATSFAMDARKPLRRGNVLKKLNTENLNIIERGLLGDLPDRLKPNYGPVRGRPTDLVVAKPSGFLSSCLPNVPDSPISLKFPSSDDESNLSPSLKKSFSFRDRFSRISFLKNKDKQDTHKWQTIVEDELTVNKMGDKDLKTQHRLEKEKSEQDKKSNKRFWFFRQKEIMENKDNRPVYKRSKSFEFLPRAIEEEEENKGTSRKILKNSQSYVYGSTDTMGEAWTSNESLEYIANVYYDDDDCVFLKSIRELSPDSSKNNSSLSTNTTVSSGGIVANIFERESVQNLLEQFEKSVDMFSETYLSDCEPYTKSHKETVKEHRKSSSFSVLPSPKVMQVSKLSEISEDFKRELSRKLCERQTVPSPRSPRSPRRGSVTDWFVLDDHAAAIMAATEDNKYRRAQKKPVNRVRRISSTKYVSA